MLLVLCSPSVQLFLHGVHVLLNVVHDLAQGVGAARQGLDGRLQSLYLLGNQLTLLAALRVRHGWALL